MRNPTGRWIFTLFVSVSRLCHTLTVECNMSWSVTTYLIKIIDTMIQSIAEGTPCKEINPAMISKHFRK